MENGTIFEGERLGADGSVTAEVVFTTGMTGYIETLTDPSYYGQIIVQTFPLIGNYGVIPEDFESKGISAGGYIAKHPCDIPSNFRSSGDLDGFLKSGGCVGLSGIDTRALTRLIREHGTMNGVICSDPDSVDLGSVKAYNCARPVDKITTKQMYTVGTESGTNVVLMDFGSKTNIVRELEKRGARVTVVPALTPASEILDLKPQGVVLSNGPGDPADNTQVIQTVAALMDSGVPIMGICLGHQLMALAKGYKTYKLKYGHRGANQPVKDLRTGRVYISSQNHGYAVDTKTAAAGVLSFVNVNDGTCEGLEYDGGRMFSVQFHPEACGGPKDSEFLFDRFFQNIKGGDGNAER